MKIKLRVNRKGSYRVHWKFETKEQRNSRLTTLHCDITRSRFQLSTFPQQCDLKSILNSSCISHCNRPDFYFARKILNFLAQSSLKLENTKRQIVGDWRKSRRGSESTESVPSKKSHAAWNWTWGVHKSYFEVATDKPYCLCLKFLLCMPAAKIEALKVKNE